jgi:hypothetical protein
VLQYPTALNVCLQAMRTYTDPDRFYGPSHGLPIGAGMIVRDCVVSTPHRTEMRFETGVGLGLVLTHECDADQQNERFFNDLVLVCPIIPLDDFCASAEEESGAGAWGGILRDIAENIVYRAMYLPPIPRTIAFLEKMEGWDNLSKSHFVHPNGMVSGHFPACRVLVVGHRTARV